MRIFSYSQLSQRYAKVNTNNKWFVTPDSILHNEEYSSEYYDLMDKVAKLYQDMLNDGIPSEDARYILPNACFTSLVVSMNARAFVEACQKRTCNKAQWEIRDMFIHMRNLIEKIYPHIYELCFPSCKTKGQCYEAKSCGKVL